MRARWVTALVVVVLGATFAAAAGHLVGRGPLEPSPPEELPDAAPPPASRASTLMVPIRVPLPRLTELVEDAIPLTFDGIAGGSDDPDGATSADSADDDRTEIAFELRRGPLDVSFSGPSAALATTLRYGVRVSYDPPLLPAVSASCGTDDDEDAPRLAVTVRSPVSLDSSWRLRTNSWVEELRPVSATERDRCRMTLFDLDVTGRVVHGARSLFAEQTPRLDSLAARAELRPSFEEWWKTLEEPIPLGDALWLVMGPESVRRGPVHGLTDSLEVALELRARPRIVYGERPSIEHRPLPPLDTGAVGEGLELHVEARAEYDSAGDFLTGELSGRRLDFEGRVVEIDSVRLFGIGGGRLAVELRVSGDVAARLYLVGTPQIDAESGRVFVPDLDFDVATRDLVLATVSWLRAGELRDFLRARASWPAAPAVRFLERWLDEGLNRDLSDDLRVRGRVESVRIESVYARRDALMVRIAARGEGRLWVTSRSAS